jgi:hypothetical protein
MKMKTYHITFCPDPNTNNSFGINIEAETMEIALKMFILKYPNNEPIYIHNKSI